MALPGHRPLQRLNPIHRAAGITGADLDKSEQGLPVAQNFDWAPTFGVGMHFLLDGVSLSFAMLITGIGALI
jgi:multicomponent Na+:H+ antiporter subunit A